MLHILEMDDNKQTDKLLIILHVIINELHVYRIILNVDIIISSIIIEYFNTIISHVTCCSLHLWRQTCQTFKAEKNGKVQVNMMVHSKTFQKLIISSRNRVTFYYAGKIKELFCQTKCISVECQKTIISFIEKLLKWSIWKGFHKGIQFDAILSKHICTHHVNYYYTAFLWEVKL